MRRSCRPHGRSRHARLAATSTAQRIADARCGSPASRDAAPAPTPAPPLAVRAAPRQRASAGRRRRPPAPAPAEPARRRRRRRGAAPARAVAQNFDHLLALASESRINAHQMQPFIASLQRFKRNQARPVPGARTAARSGRRPAATPAPDRTVGAGAAEGPAAQAVRCTSTWPTSKLRAARAGGVEQPGRRSAGAAHAALPRRRAGASRAWCATWRAAWARRRS